MVAEISFSAFPIRAGQEISPDCSAFWKILCITGRKGKSELAKSKGFRGGNLKKATKYLAKMRFFVVWGTKGKMKKIRKSPSILPCQVLKGVGGIFQKMPPQSWQKNIFLRRGGIAGRKALLKCLVSERRVDNAVSIALLVEAKMPRKICSKNSRRSWQKSLLRNRGDWRKPRQREAAVF